MLKRPDQELAIRPAKTGDVAQMAALAEGKSSAAFIRNVLHRKSACVLVAAAGKRIQGYAVVLFRPATSVARIHSVVADPELRSRHVTDALVRTAEEEARRRSAIFLRIEIGAEACQSSEPYLDLGYRKFRGYLDYYDRAGSVTRLEKSLSIPAPRTKRNVPFYHQTTDFTCGPCALMMTMAGLGSNEPMSRELEFQLWREATSIYLISAPGGCDPIGLAVAARRRGFGCEVYVNQPGPYFTQVRQGAQRLDVMSEAQRIFARQAEELKIPVRQHELGIEDAKAALTDGAIVISLISTHRMYGDRTPHWIAVYDHADGYFFAHDPWVGAEDLELPIQKAGIAIPVPEFARMSVWGRCQLKAALIVRQPRQ
ncbi:MAG: peptidase C39 family protein [Rhizobiales bacterium]|nr:peptidase C39 family protein [Hyphomicrobiales bacterium]